MAKKQDAKPKKRSSGGRKPSLSKSKVKAAIEGSGGVLATIAESCGVHRITLWRYLQKPTSEDLLELISQETERISDVAKHHLMSRVVNNDWKAIRFWLVTKNKAEFSERTEHTGEAGGPIKLEKQVFDLGDGERVEF